ncbi:glycosyltransferase family 4 protein [Coraliomargarita parva]|uniref:glycosyltransferase family 4 protein n=1 Tax=Coraliomargarita parva TaxID=3014050 RepID=UPI0022B35845|nr:glycosyltransferase family 4 protein [Coraliomargarita parva]
MHLVFWQPIPSFHQEGFLVDLAKSGWVTSVTLKFESELPVERRATGWREGCFEGVQLEPIRLDEVPESSADHVHIFTGFLTHRNVWSAYRRLPKDAPCRCLAYAEAPECIGFKGLLRRLKYAVNARRLSGNLDAVLAIGDLGARFYRGILPSSVKVCEFAYYDVRKADIEAQRCSLEALRGVTPFRFLYVGQLIWRKGLDRLFKALAQVPSRLEWQLVIVGDGAARAELKKLADDLGISSRLQWSGVVPSKEVAGYYRRADCAVLPSRWDGWGMAVNEALLTGCPILVSPSCGAASAVSSEYHLSAQVSSWSALLAQRIEKGATSQIEREHLRKLASQLTAEVGTIRLLNLLRTL